MEDPKMSLNHTWEYKESEDSHDIYQCDDCKLVVYKADYLSLEQALYYEGILSLCLGRIMETHRDYVRVDDGCGH